MKSEAEIQAIQEEVNQLEIFLGILKAWGLNNIAIEERLTTLQWVLDQDKEQTPAEEVANEK